MAEDVAGVHPPPAAATTRPRRRLPGRARAHAPRPALAWVLGLPSHRVPDLPPRHDVELVAHPAGVSRLARLPGMPADPALRGALKSKDPRGALRLEGL